MEKTYGSSTEDFLKNVSAKEPRDYTLKQIAQNLAYIADELAHENEELHNISNGVFCIRDFLESDFAEILHQDKGHKTRNTVKCFICGRDVSFERTGGLIVDSDGNVIYACSDCKPKFDAIIGDIVGRKVRC